MQPQFYWTGKPIEHLTRDEMLEALRFVCDRAVAWKAQAIEIKEIAEQKQRAKKEALQLIRGRVIPASDFLD